MFILVLPIESILPALLGTLQQHQLAVLQAPPGAGKTTRVPLAALQCPWLGGRILLIQPRRLAVYNAARRLAQQLGEATGSRVGLHTRYEREVSADTRIEVITDGIFLTRLQQDPELKGVGLVLFDEFHERSVNLDLGLAFALEARAALREPDNPLRLLVMSATLDGERLSQWLQAPLLVSEGRQYPVTTHYRPAPLDRNPIDHITQVVREALASQPGSLLVFVPGMGEIRAVQRRLEAAELAPGVDLFPLHASLPRPQQQAALEPSPPGRRKVVLATNVAETSITIEDVQVVIDSGQVRVARYDERRGLDRLHTEMVSAAAADQRRGRAGRTGAGVCYRLWGESRQAGLKPFADPQILTTDLQPVALELARWGARDATELTLLDPPPAPRLARARAQLTALGALRADGAISPLGRQLASLGLSPRLALLVWSARGTAAAADTIACAALLTEGVPQGTSGTDLRRHLEALNGTPAPGPWRRVRRLQQQLQRRLDRERPPGGDQVPAITLPQALARAFPDRIARQRSEQPRRYQLSNGKGLELAPGDALQQSLYLVVLDAGGGGSDLRLHLACPITEAELTAALDEHIQSRETVAWDASREAVKAEQQHCLGALVLRRSPLLEPAPEAVQATLMQALRARDLEPLPWNRETRQFCQRCNWWRQQNRPDWPDFSTPALAAELEHWLAPFLAGSNSFADLSQVNLLDALQHRLGWDQLEELDRCAPTAWPLATGRRALDYSNDGPTLSVRLQEVLGLDQHPCLADGTPITLELLSPARRPLQITRDLPGFWRGSYQEVAKEMRGRYPKHVWPEDPARAQATTLSKRALQR
ncbi:MAG: ATP-dependent helicase HrpB [Pseudomonadota bacterium]|nr:ATP-dependent helicase HrpB [Pseudomonadota bacterium]